MRYQIWLKQSTVTHPAVHVQGSIQDLSWGGGGGSRMILVCEMHACLLGGSGGMPLQKNFEFIYLSDRF